MAPAQHSSVQNCTSFKPAERQGGCTTSQVEVSWDASKAKWLVRIVNGEEVIRRYCSLPKNADEKAVAAAAQKTVQDEGYEADAALVSIRR